MAINDEELLAAVSGGIDSAGGAPAPVEITPPGDTADDDTADTGTDDADGDAGGDEGEVSEPKDGDTGAEADDGKDDEPEIDPKTGKPVVKADDEPAPEIDPATGKPFTAEQIKAKKDKEDFQKAQVDDPINAPIPKYLKETTQKRMTKLVDIAKDLTTKSEALQRDRDMIVSMVTDTGATATQYTSALQYLKMVNSRDPAQIKQAISVMQQELAALSRMAGVPVAGVDHLANHPDLKAALDAKQITPELAEEIAASREQKTFQDHSSRAVQQSTEQAQQAHTAGVQALNEVGRRLSADPGYRLKAAAVLKQIGPELQRLPPAQWAQSFLLAYTTYKAPVAPTPPKPKTVVVPKNQPLRGNNPSGGQQSAPKSLEDAINMGIAAGTRR
jgi:proline-rich tail region repeat protein